ncbi:MAG TPA: molybdenum cofactor guanylyltransferase [Anaeromyxobacteraceae bacterium]|nr:molybdenum cofactor guanylyltransferase [Anaeromyxobacteraceae bacterium]
MHRPDDAPRLADCTGVLVAGGRASRLGGVPKGLLRIDGEAVAARAARLFGGMFAESLLVANDPAPYASLGLRAVPDALPGKGAPGGLHAALAAARTSWVFLAACDMPFLAEGPIRWLAARRGDARAAAVVWQGRLEPLHAFWARSALPEVDRMVRAGEPSMWQIATAVGARFVTEAEWREIDPDGRAFANANTPEDVERLGLELP